MASLRTIIIFLIALGTMPVAMALSLQGVTGFANRVEMNAATSGIVQGIEVQPGQRVAKGDILLRLDDTPQRARVKRAEANAKALQPDVTIAQLELERAEELYALESLSQVDLQRAENKMARAEGDFLAAQAEAELAAYELQQTVLMAPFDGRVIELHVNVSEYVDPTVENAPLATVVDSRNMLAIARLAAAQWRESLVSKAASVKVANKTYQGRVSFLAFDQQENSTAGGYLLHVSFSTERPLPAGLPVSIEIKE